VKCLRIYQSGLEGRYGDFNAESVTLQYHTGDRLWKDVCSWGPRLHPADEALPGWAWLTLPVGKSYQVAYSECARSIVEPSGRYWFQTCCVLPYIPMSRSDNGLSFSEGVQLTEQRCSPGSTVSSGTSCRVWSPNCHSTAQLSCVQGDAQLILPLDVPKGCADEEMLLALHGSPISVIPPEAKTTSSTHIVILATIGLILLLVFVALSFVLWRKLAVKRRSRLLQHSAPAPAGTPEVVIGSPLGDLPYNPREEPVFPDAVVLGQSPQGTIAMGTPAPGVSSMACAEPGNKTMVF